MLEIVSLAILLLAAAGLAAAAAAILFRIRRKPIDREKRRRLAVNAHGRLTDGNITEANGDVIFYSYSAGGVDYATSQDLAELRGVIVASLDQLIGSTVVVKYAMRNPANSIVVCEQWSGLRAR